MNNREQEALDNGWAFDHNFCGDSTYVNKESVLLKVYDDGSWKIWSLWTAAINEHGNSEDKLPLAKDYLIINRGK